MFTELNLGQSLVKQMSPDWPGFEIPARSEAFALCARVYFVPRCPSCQSINVRHSRRRNLFERVLLLLVLKRPWKCRTCGHRYYALLWG